jgi:hypothetical protein
MNRHHRSSAAILAVIVVGQVMVGCGAGSGSGSPVTPRAAVARSTPATSSDHDSVDPVDPVASTTPIANGTPTGGSGSTNDSSSTNDSASSVASVPATIVVTSIPVVGRSGQAATGGDPSVRATQACQLVTEQDAKAALGTDPGKGIATDLSGGATACSYIAGASTLQLSLTPSGGKAAFDLQRAHLPKDNPAIAVVSGIGDGAFTQVLGTRAAVNFAKGDAMVVMGLNLAGATKPPLEPLEVVAMAAAGKL